MRQAKKYWFYNFLSWCRLYAKDENGETYMVGVLVDDYDDPQKMEHDLLIKMQKMYGITTAY